jgi:hypothetical protein
MATTSIWAGKGWLGKVVIYAENPDKTANPAYYEKQNMTEQQAQGLSDVIDYAAQSQKTQLSNERAEIMQHFVTGVNCHADTARDQMLIVKSRHSKTEGIVAFHGYQSFAPGEATPEMAHEIGVKLTERLWGERCQVLVATHLDKSSLHNHFIINTVSHIDGKKFHRTEKDYYDMQKTSDALCREYGLSVIEKPKRGKSKQYAEYNAEQKGHPTWRGMVKSDVDAAIRQSMTERQFFDNLRKMGYEIKVGNVRGTTDGKTEPFRHGLVTHSTASLVFEENINPEDLPEVKIPQGDYELLSEEDIEERLNKKEEDTPK